MTGYALLALLTQPSLSQEDLALASRVIRWLVRQQNPYGGFASTQVNPLLQFHWGGGLKAGLASA